MTGDVRKSRDRIAGCLLGGALGDALGGVPERGVVSLSDDTQLTLATCESIIALRRVDSEHLAATFLRWFRGRRISGLGSSTLKALRDLEAGTHWAVAGARGEMAAGNGGAMRIAPLAFVVDVMAERQIIRDVVRITHANDEAYLGALAVVLAIQSPQAPSAAELLLCVAEHLPDCRVRDRLRQVAEVGRSASIQEVASRFGASGYVVDTVPLALFAAWSMLDTSFAVGLQALTEAGGDTDTIASIAGQVAGSHCGLRGLPDDLLAGLPERAMVEEIVSAFAESVGAG